MSKIADGSELKFANKKLQRADFRGGQLVHADFRGAQLAEADFTGANLRYADFTGANCWGANFTDTDLYRSNMKDCVLANSIMKPKDCFGVTITLSCDTVENMQINEKFWFAWLMMSLLMQPPNQEAADKLIAVIGPERHQRYLSIFRERTV